MARVNFSNGSYMVGVRSSQSCPICGAKDGRCSVLFSKEDEVIYYACRNVFSSDGTTSNNLYKHFPNKTNVSSEQIKQIKERSVKENEITIEVLLLRDRVYRRFRELLKFYDKENLVEGTYLYERDYKNLADRGLSKEMIIRMGFFSVPNREHKVWFNEESNSYKCRLETAISKHLYKEFGDDLLLVAGFIKVQDGKGNDFITYKSTFYNHQTEQFEAIEGYFIPYHHIADRNAEHSHDGLLMAIQYRLSKEVYDEKGKLVRYFWFSSKNCSSGSPVDYYAPLDRKTFKNKQGEEIRLLLVTEGALKGKIACEYFGCEGIFMAGVATVKTVANRVKALEKLTGHKYHVISAFDMDKYDNFFLVNDENGEKKKVYPILKAEAKLISYLKMTGNETSCAILEWDKSSSKGVDEAMVMGLRKQWRVI